MKAFCKIARPKGGGGGGVSCMTLVCNYGGRQLLLAATGEFICMGFFCFN